MSTGCRLGILAFGDSITNGGGELQWGVALQSWALWVARATGLPFTSYAFDGARARDVTHEQVAAFERDAALAKRQPRYDLGCLYVGVNDVRAIDWDAVPFARDHRAALVFLTERCDRTITLTAPLDLGRPRARAKVVELDEIIEQNAHDVGALTLDLRAFKARNHVMADHVHPTAFGQIAIAHGALRALERDGMPVGTPPASLIQYETTRWRRLRGDATYVYRHAKVSGRAVFTRLAASRPPPSPPAAGAPGPQSGLPARAASASFP